MMAVFGMCIPVLILLVPVLLWLLYRYLTSTFDTFTKLGIPGPKPIPMFGTTHLIFKGLLQHDMDMHKRYGKLVGIFNSRRPALMVNDVAFLKQILVKEFSSFRNRQGFPVDGPLDKRVSRLQDEQWKYVRNHVSSAFSGQKLRNMMPAINKCSKNVVKNIRVDAETGDAVECKEYMSSFTMDTIASAAFNIDINTQVDKDNIFVCMANDLFNKDKKWFVLLLLTVVPFVAPYLKYFGVEIINKQAVEFFMDITRTAVKHREENPDEIPNDFLQLLLSSRIEEEADASSPGNQKRQGLTEEEVLAQCLLFFMAGYHSTSMFLSLTLYSLAVHPECQQRLYEEILEVVGKEGDPDYDKLKKLKYMDMCISETLRMYPVEPRSDRVTNENATIQGLTISKGCVIVISIHALHHDSEAWPEPDKYDPERMFYNRVQGGFLPSHQPE